MLDLGEFLFIDGTNVVLVAGNSMTATNAMSVNIAFTGSTATVTVAKAGGISAAAMQGLIAGLAYSNNDEGPTAGARVATLVSLRDVGSNVAPNDNIFENIGISTTITVVPVNDVPVVTTPGTVNTFIEGAGLTTGTPVVVDTAITVADIDNANLASATISITGGLQSGDVLSFTPQSGIIDTNAAADILALSGSATLAEWQTVLRSITFATSNQDPSTSRTISFQVSDGISPSNTATKSVTITPVNDEPTLTATGLNPGFTENGAFVDLFSGPAASAIEAGQTLNNLIVTVSNVAGTGSTERLVVDNAAIHLINGNNVGPTTNGMTVSVALSGGTATVTIARVGGVSAAVIQSIIDGLSYQNLSENPGNATRTVTITSLMDNGGTANGGDDTVNPALTSAVTVTPVNDTPVIDLVTGGAVDTTATTATFNEGAGPPSTAVAIVPNLDLIDVDSANLTGATVTLTNMQAGQDVLTVNGSTSGSIGGVGFNVSGNVITFTGTASVDAYEAAIEAVQYNNTSEAPAPGTRTFDIQVDDGQAANNLSTVATATVNVVGQNDAPVNSVPASITVHSNTPFTITGLSIGDVDAGGGEQHHHHLHRR